jgi:hypothetical protein
MMHNFVWNVFLNTGSVEAYLLYRDFVNAKDKEQNEHVLLAVEERRGEFN